LSVRNACIPKSRCLTPLSYCQALAVCCFFYGLEVCGGVFFCTCRFCHVCIFGPSYILITCFQVGALRSLTSNPTAAYVKILLFLFLHLASVVWFQMASEASMWSAAWILDCGLWWERSIYLWIFWCFILFHHLSTEAEIFFEPKARKKA
jgi:hypothetical protein